MRGLVWKDYDLRVAVGETVTVESVVHAAGYRSEGQGGGTGPTVLTACGRVLRNVHELDRDTTCRACLARLPR